ncbi:unnamed protein product, partial [Ascophyllum nodosum]
IPPDLGKLSALQSLDLSHNQLDGLGDAQDALQLVSRFDSGTKLLLLIPNPWKMPPEAVVEQGLGAI